MWFYWIDLLPGPEPEADVVNRGRKRRRDQSAEYQRLKDSGFGALDRLLGGQMQMGHGYLLAKAGNFQIVNTEIGLLVPLGKSTRGFHRKAELQ
jgi:hypothetical protein